MKLLATTALALVLASPAWAGPSLGEVTIVYGYDTPDGQSFNSVTTTATGAPDTLYSYYTGPVVFHSSWPDITVYCVDLNHFLQTPSLYLFTKLTTNGEGQPISEFDSNRIGHIALIGAAALAAGGTANLDLAAAAQAAIWDISYDTDSPLSTSADPTISADISTLLGDVFPNVGYAMAMQPYAQGWPESGSASQEMVMGLTTGVPEPSTWAMGLIGFGLIGLMGYRKRWTVAHA
jgi:PEP-CTERM motif